ncbi:MAG: hypothetical protein ACE149_10310 [Armatimonadota bacterium]
MEPDHIRRRHPLTRIVITALIVLIAVYLLVTAFYKGGRPVPEATQRIETPPPAPKGAPGELPPEVEEGQGAAGQTPAPGGGQ